MTSAAGLNTEINSLSEINHHVQNIIARLEPVYYGVFKQKSNMMAGNISRNETSQFNDSCRMF